MSKRRAVVGVMGAGEGASAEAVALAEELGECISARGWVLLTGGRPAGVMAAASRGAARVEGHLVIWVLPDEGNGEERQSTAELDLALFTGMGKPAADSAGSAAGVAGVLLLARQGSTERK
ncbi:MAG: hypothetical protein QUV07_13595 [Cyanobium sp. CZS 25K]|nr:hypothetical protein [Cyanobium sp. CZS25K]